MTDDAILAIVNMTLLTTTSLYSFSSKDFLEFFLVSN